MTDLENSMLSPAYLKAAQQLFKAEESAGLGRHTIVLKEVTVKDSRKRQMVDDSYNLNGKGNADQVIGFDYFSKASCSTIEQCLEGRLNGVIFKDHRPYLARNIVLGTPMLLVVNGIKVQQEMVNGFFQSTPASEIGSVEVLKTPAYESAYDGSTGVILINLRNAADDEYLHQQDKNKPGLVLPGFKGYYRVRTFYSPLYDNPQTNYQVADLRTTVFWKPNMVTDQNGHASFEFNNAGSPGTYRVTIEGIDADGKLGRKVIRYKVE
ncbi:hypothetical protein [Mucilaginibacter sp. KACC 22063]|uniref:hypothetical protein n=1 Tax=Mucilaginibacter sp. KACC 22063 TaxID=3025666 RepID=UPI002365B555|nr:hypothetical protein [Mucilaginibacter sp. KACC 22063]WDF55824.1 hypothetical protein PQ461_01955 [Mucilaginibacter sp. KACC 22063]